MDLSPRFWFYSLPLHGQRYQRLAQTFSPKLRVRSHIPIATTASQWTILWSSNTLILTCRHTKPGGYVEFIDLDLNWVSPDSSLSPEHASLKFNREFLKASRKAGTEPCPGPLLEGLLKGAGFEDVVARKYIWPVGTWPADRHLVSRPQPAQSQPQSFLGKLSPALSPTAAA